MSKDIYSKKFSGVIHRILEDKSKTYYIKYKNPISKKTERLKIGNSKDGFNEMYCSNKRNELLSKLRLGEDPQIPILKNKTKQHTLNDIYESYISTKKIKSLIHIKSRYTKHLYNDLGSKSLNNISKSDIVKLQNKLLNLKLANATINDIILLGSTIFNYGIKTELHQGINPFYGFKGLKVNNDRARYLSKDDIELLKKNTKQDPILYLFVLLSVTTGARLESVLNIQKKDINLETNTINIKDLKNDNRYNGAITNEVKEILKSDLLSHKKDDYIVSYDQGMKMDKRRIQRRLSPILNKLFNSDLSPDDRVNRVVIHTLRHSFASLLAINGVPIYTIQKLMNHKDIKQTTRYAKLSPENGTNAVMSVFN